MNMAEKILIVDDEKALLETLAYNLKHQGYDVDTAEDGPSAIEAARRIHPDAIILDIMLPGMDGFEVCRTLRQEMNTPVLMLTARDDEIDRVVGLEVGADDYLTKPFSMRELLARVKAMLRRVRLIREEMSASDEPAVAPHKVLRFDSLVIDDSRHEVTLDNAVLTLKPKEYELLLYMAQHRGQVLSREQILERVWGWDYIGDSRTVDVHVRWLREKIEASPIEPKRIVTVRGAGYRFEG
jgi:DNA-binding response OmpR family regulator